MIAMNGGGLSHSVNIFWMYGSFHLEVLVAVGDTLCPFRRTMDDSSVPGLFSIAVDPASPGSCWDGPCLVEHGRLGEIAAVPLQAFLADGLMLPFE